MLMTGLDGQKTMASASSRAFAAAGDGTAVALPW